MSDVVVNKVLGRPMKISTIFKAAKASGEYYKEEPANIWIGREDFALASSLAGVIYVAIDYEFDPRLMLKVDRYVVARGNLDIFLWLLDNAPASLRAGIDGLIAYERESND